MYNIILIWAQILIRNDTSQNTCSHSTKGSTSIQHYISDLYYLPRIPVGLSITEVDDVSVAEGVRKDDVLVGGRPAIQK